MVSSQFIYACLIAAVGLERLFELYLSRRNLARAIARGGKEYGAGHFPAMAAAHTLLLVACVGEVFLLDRTFDWRVGGPALCLVILAQGLRYWAITTLGDRWNVRIVVVPGLPLVSGGPYRFLRHPNYLAVVVEILALPLVHGAWMTAAVFTAVNAAILSVRIRAEEAALGIERS